MRVDNVRHPLREREAHAPIGVLEELLNSSQLIAVLVSCVRSRLRCVRDARLSHDLLKNHRTESPRPVEADDGVLDDLNTTLHDVDVVSDALQHAPRNASIDELQVRRDEILRTTREGSAVLAESVERVGNERVARPEERVKVAVSTWQWGE